MEEKKDFDEKLRNINNRVTSNRTKQIGADNKLADCITSYAKLINDLAK